MKAVCSRLFTGNSEVGVQMIPITFVDLETTGLDSETNEIIELAAIKANISDGCLRFEESVEFKVHPMHPVDPFVAKLNGYNEEVWERDSGYLDKALGEIFRLMRGSWHAGSNPIFDERFMKKAAKKFHWTYPKLASYHLIDVTMMAFPLLVNGDVEELKQETISEYYEIDGGGHRALADSIQCAKIFAKINNLEFVW